MGLGGAETKNWTRESRRPKTTRTPTTTTPTLRLMTMSAAAAAPLWTPTSNVDVSKCASAEELIAALRLTTRSAMLRRTDAPDKDDSILPARASAREQWPALGLLSAGLGLAVAAAAVVAAGRGYGLHVTTVGTAALLLAGAAAVLVLAAVRRGSRCGRKPLLSPPAPTLIDGQPVAKPAFVTPRDLAMDRGSCLAAARRPADQTANHHQSDVDEAQFCPELHGAHVYLRDFLARPHPDVGRKGPVCPFVPGALKSVQIIQRRGTRSSTACLTNNLRDPPSNPVKTPQAQLCVHGRHPHARRVRRQCTGLEEVADCAAGGGEGSQGWRGAAGVG